AAAERGEGVDFAGGEDRRLDRVRFLGVGAGGPERARDAFAGSDRVSVYVDGSAPLVEESDRFGGGCFAGTFAAAGRAYEGGEQVERCGATDERWQVYAGRGRGRGAHQDYAEHGPGPDSAGPGEGSQV